MDLEVDDNRYQAAADEPGTGIYVRAKHNGKFESVDIVTLTYESLMAWLRRGGDNPMAERTVAILLGHDPHDDSSPVQEELYGDRDT